MLWENARGPHDQGLVSILHNRVMLLDKLRKPWMPGANQGKGTHRFLSTSTVERK
ncbi:unnamed protein product, partial [Ectocarpus sp. 13 AM-2016]